MARRRKKQNESFLDVLLSAPWQVSVFVGVVVFIGLKWILPILGAGNMFLKPLTQMFAGIAWLCSGFFFVIAAFVFAKSAMPRPEQVSTTFPKSKGRETASRQSSPWAKSAPSPRKEPSLNGDPMRQGPVGEPPEVLPERPTEWSIDLIREIEWKKFEDVCQKFYETKGIRSATTPLGPDGGIDIRLYQEDSGLATSVVQCKAWGDRFVGVKPVRELLGVMTHERIGKAFFMTSGRFSDDAKEVAKSNRITLIDGEMLLMMFTRLPETEKNALLAFATEGDYKTPTCPSCGIKMRHVPGKAGRPSFWGCQNFPRCRQMLGMKREA